MMVKTSRLLGSPEGTGEEVPQRMRAAVGPAGIGKAVLSRGETWKRAPSPRAMPPVNYPVEHIFEPHV